ncbi:MAG: hypothetical protein V6Z86_05120 [Hyphomicrobiales bacterium]
MSARKRSATESLRDDLQHDFCELLEDFNVAEITPTPSDELTLHLCVFIERDILDTGEETLTARAELVVEATCSDLGITGCKYRLPLDLEGMVKGVRHIDGASCRDEGAVETKISVRRKS